MTNMVYIRMKRNIQANIGDVLRLKDISFITTTTKDKESLLNTVVYRITKSDKEMVVIDSFLVIEHLNNVYSNLEFQLLGPNESIIRVQAYEKKRSIFVVAFVWILLFIGTAMTIMNFHYDVSMQEVHEKLHLLMTGEVNKSPLWIQIPYSFGLGIGMLLFLNHWFKKRFNEEPSPLEIELYNYQQNIDQYVSYHENKINDE